jgi:hypothetical protein
MSRVDPAGEIRRTEGCANPIRLCGWRERIDPETGELMTRIATARQPGGVLLVPCRDRRAAKCPSCAETYRADAFQLVASGLRGGKGVPESVAGHPVVMVTLTAPSFGRVHTIRDRDGGCPCGDRHVAEDATLGSPIDAKTYRYDEQAAWNHLAPTLWKRTAQAIRRRLARELGVPRDRLTELARVRFVKACEFQRRGVVHFHVVIRVDGPDDPATEPPAQCTAAMLERVVRSSVREIELQLAEAARPIRWGREIEVVPLDATEVGRAAGYIAKYATKATETAAGGAVIPRVRSRREVVALQVPRHAKQLVLAAWRVGGAQGLERARSWSHQFGYGGHTLTKSRDYSVTFTALRAARAAWRAGTSATCWTSAVVRGTLVYTGRGYLTPEAAWLAGGCPPHGFGGRWPPRVSEGLDGEST